MLAAHQLCTGGGSLESRSPVPKGLFYPWNSDSQVSGGIHEFLTFYVHLDTTCVLVNVC